MTIHMPHKKPPTYKERKLVTATEESALEPSVENLRWGVGRRNLCRVCVGGGERGWGGGVTKTRLYSFDRLKPHFYIIFFLFC